MLPLMMEDGAEQSMDIEMEIGDCAEVYRDKCFQQQGPLFGSPFKKDHYVMGLPYL